MDSLESPIVELVGDVYEQRARERIKNWIQSTHMTQADLGERIGRNQEWMSRYLSGKLNTDIQTLEKMAAVFGHTLFGLLHLPSDPQETRLLEFYRALPAASRSSLLDFLATFYPGTFPPSSRSSKSRA
jgi:transcriptional regulator with XRE-family HTH domain